MLRFALAQLVLWRAIFAALVVLRHSLELRLKNGKCNVLFAEIKTAVFSRYSSGVRSLALPHPVLIKRGNKMQQKINFVSVFALTYILSGCGTLLTLAPEKGKVNISYNDKKSYCQSIPRVYSGVAHNFCLMYGEPNKTSYTTAADLPVWAIDTVFCAVTDTLALPYTLSRQIKDGSLQVER